MSRWMWFYSIVTKLLWLRASLFGVAAVLTTVVAILVQDYIPQSIPTLVGASAIDDILNILASSMLAVTIFSVSTMVAAYSSATSNVTPRATKLLIEDRLSHNVLSTFIGTFIFSLVGIIALKTGAFSQSGRLLFFVVTLFVIVLIIVTLLRWIEYLVHLGRVNETIERVETVVTDCLILRLKKPYFGANPLLDYDDIPTGSVPIYACKVGYVQYIDVEALNEIAEKAGGQIYVNALPGTLVHPAMALAFAYDISVKDCHKQLHKAFIVDRERSYRQDPRFGMAVLSEIASRALSPAINDHGTAIHVISVGLRILLTWAKRDELRESGDVSFPLVHVPSIEVSKLFDDFFSPIERDGAALYEIANRLQYAFRALAESGDPQLEKAAREHSATSFRHNKAAMRLESDVEKLLPRCLD